MIDIVRYESHYAQPLARKKGAKLTDAEEVKPIKTLLRILSPNNDDQMIFPVDFIF